MPSTSAIDSLLFRHLTNRAQPSIAHPTADRFDFDDWMTVLPQGYSDRDETLIRTALIVNEQVRKLRDDYISKAFVHMSPSQLVMLAIALANRGFLLIRHKMHEALKEHAATAKVAHFSAMSQVEIISHQGASPQAAADLNTTMIDSLPHWFAAAAKLADKPEEDQDFSEAGLKGEMLFSLNNSFREVWQQVLWAPWEIENAQRQVLVSPLHPAEEAMWRIWDWREQSLLHQGAILNRHIERRYPQATKPSPIPTTVRTFTAGSPPTIELGVPTAEQSIKHRSALDILNDSYVAIFLDQQLNVDGVTPRLLAHATLLLEDLLDAALPNEPDPARADQAWIQRMSCCIPRGSIVEVIAKTLSIADPMANAVIHSLTSDPWGPLAKLFNPGLWHRPLIATKCGADLMIVAGALAWGSPLRAVERWLQEGKGADLSKTSNGERYERELRNRVSKALAGNPILSPFASEVRHMPAGPDCEEIDLIVCVGKTLIVGEVKCFLKPTEPSERYDYLRKLEEAAAQARRKAEWLSANPQAIGATPIADIRLMPLVIVNQSNGASWSFDGCAVVDAKWFELFLSSGEYHSAAALSLDGSADPVFTAAQLYTSLEEAEQAMPAIFEDHPGLRLFRAAVDWSAARIPLADRRTLFMAHPVMNIERYTANFAVP
ncbi:hypothetical protein GCM10009424_26030 [Sphingomonas ursincola]|uniref:NERD domain-containing protein n=1 Tax=Sphingomonas ursincola TaxID=56361 RepID=A0A7V8U841_9SPHN|nr:hypothetical protein [Sphingomonas ursincola]MBA1373658.1 hypothetical protein [Sphingomonas ursincola]